MGQLGFSEASEDSEQDDIVFRTSRWKFRDVFADRRAPNFGIDCRGREVLFHFAPANDEHEMCYGLGSTADWLPHSACESDGICSDCSAFP